MTLESLKRHGRKALPSLFTIGNMALGFFAMLMASDDNFYLAGWLLIGGIVCDMLDGRVARLVQAESEFGAEFDSMADFCAFGVAPAYIMYEFALKDYGALGYPVAFVFALCAGLRLARFNLAALHGESSKTYFQGLPSPAAAGTVASFLLAYTILEQHRPVPLLRPLLAFLPWVYVAIPYLMVGLGLLMVSNVPYPAFKGGGLRPRSVSGLLLLVGFLSLIFMFPQSALFLLACVYILSGLFLGLRALSRGA